MATKKPSATDRFFVAPIVNGEVAKGRTINITGPGLTVTDDEDTDTTTLTVETGIDATLGVAATITKGQAIRTTSSGKATPAVSLLRTRPLSGVAKDDATTADTVPVHSSGPLSRDIKNLGAGVACAVGVNASGVPVRATDPTCISAPNWLGFCDSDGTITVAPIHRGHFDPSDFGAVPEDNTAAAANAVALAAMLSAMPGGATAVFQPGTWYTNENFIISTPIVVRGTSRNNCFLNFTVAGKGVRLYHEWMSAAPGSIYAHFTDMHVSCTKSSLAEWQAGHAYVVGDRVRSKLRALATTGASPTFGSRYQHDHGFHMRCIQAGTSGTYATANAQPTWSIVPEGAGNAGDEQTVDGGCIWATEDWSGISVSANLVHVERNIITNPTDNGIAVFGFAVRTLADVAVISGNLCLSGDGNGIHNTGYDANASLFASNTCNGFERGAIIHDDGALGNHHEMNNGATCRRSYFSSNPTPNHTWMNNYFENDCGPVCFLDDGPSIWISGQGTTFAPETTCTRFDGNRWVGGLIMRTVDQKTTVMFGGSNYRERLIGPANAGGGMIEPFVADDGADPSTGGYWSKQALGGVGPRLEDTLDESSLYGPFRKRFPTGFFLGTEVASPARRQIFFVAHKTPPGPGDLTYLGRLLWRKGDVVMNSLAGDIGVSPGWVAARNGGWGGGVYSSVRTWSASRANVLVGEGLEPSVANGFVYRLLRYEVLVSAVWVRDDNVFGAVGTISGTEPTWPTTLGTTVTDTIDGTHRIIWECWGPVGMTWSEMPKPTSQITTFVPTDLGSALKAWYHADDASVNAWPERVGGDANKDLAQGTGANQPTIVASEPLLNDKQCVSFPDDIVNAKYMTSGTWTVPLTQPCMVFISAVQTGTSGNHYMFDAKSAHRMGAFGTSSRTNVDMYAGAGPLPNGTSTDTSVAHVMAFEFNSATSKMFKDSNIDDVTGDAGTDSPLGIVVGNYAGLAAGNSGWKIRQILFVQGSLNATQREELLRYLAADIGTTVA